MVKTTSDFFDFEIKNKLFDIVDENGFRPWDIIRYFVYCQIVRQGNCRTVDNKSGERKSRIWTYIKNIFIFVFYLFRHRKRDYLFILCSRDKKNDIFYDKILDNLYCLTSQEKRMAFESYDTWRVKNYKYGEETCTSIFAELLCKFLKKRKYDSKIDEIIKQKYPDISLNFNEFYAEYNRFYSLYKFWSFVLKFCGIKKIFLVQNGIQKGLFAAAAKINVQVFELQHGQFSRNHLAYSYPEIMLNDSDKIYHPNYLLTFGSFWMKNCTYPGVKVIPLGNDFFSQMAEKSNSEITKKILVISSFVHGDVLSDCVRIISENDESFFFYFKLHPNEYDYVDKYEKYFSGLKNVTIIKSEKTINELLRETEFVFLVQSTTELEALKNGKKVIVLRRLDYEVLDFVFNEKGIYFIDEAEEFIDCYNAHKDEKIEPRNDIFQPFDKAKALELLKC